jgi:hypothetical protein
MNITDLHSKSLYDHEIGLPSQKATQVDGPMAMYAAAIFALKLVPFYQTTQRHFPEDSNHHILLRENLISHKMLYILVY